MIPVLFLTYGRLEYTKQSYYSLLHSDCSEIIVIDNNSTDGTKEWLKQLTYNHQRVRMFFNDKNLGIAGAMNQFLRLTEGCAYVGKVDNDTMVPPNWGSVLIHKMIKYDIDIMQAKHSISDATFPGADFMEWMKTMKQEEKDPSIFYHHFVGGSGMIFRRNKIDYIPETEWKLYGWCQWQKSHPELKKALCTDVEIDLLDMKKEGGTRYDDYPSYYRETRRII
jgi:GT2 family glycosyltransferase